MDDLDIYKFRRNRDRTRSKMFTFKRHSEDADEVLKATIDLENIGINKTKKYAIMQETRSEFTNSKLRLLLLVYTNSAWQILVLSTIFICFIVDTWLYTFLEASDRYFGVIIGLIIANLIFTCDVLIVVGLRFSKKWRKTLNLVETNMFPVIFDVVLSLPYAILYLIQHHHTYNIDFHFLAPLAASLRVHRILQYYSVRSTQAGSNQWTTFLFQYLTLFVLSVHTSTCVWYFFSYRKFDLKKLRSSWTLNVQHLPTETTMDWYFVCAYWSVMFLTTNGLGDIYPVTTSERIAGITIIIIGFLLTTIVFVGSLTSQFITITTRNSNYVRQLKKIENHLILIKMDKDTTQRIIRYYEDLWYQKSGVFQPKLLKLLPFPLQMEICYDLNAVPLYSSLLFRKLPEPFLRRLSLSMSHQFYLPGDIVYKHNQNKTIMVCITSGVLELLSDEDDESPMISFTKGTCFGEIALVYNMPARCTVKAATYVECQVLHKAEFIKLMVTYPDIVDILKHELGERVRRSHRRKLKETDSVLSLNIFVSKDRKKSSIKCLKERLRYLQGKTIEDRLTKEDYLDEHCLDLYILSEHVKKKTKMFTCMSSSFPWILEAECYLVKYWELYMLAVTFYTCIAYPYFIGYMRKFPRTIIFYFDVIIIASLACNLLVSLVTAVKTKKKYLNTFTEILQYRMNTLGFYLDITAIIPFEYLILIQLESMFLDEYRAHLFYMSKGIKLCLVWRVANFFDKLEKKLTYNTIIIKVTKYCTYILLLCYWCGVILYMESCFVSRCSESSWYTAVLLEYRATGVRIEYPILTSLYFATSILSSVGYGDIVPQDQCDMLVVAFLSLYGVLFIGYCVAEFSSVVTHWSRTKTAFLEVIITIGKFIEDNNMHSTIESRIMAFYELQWLYNSGVEITGDNWLQKTVVPAELRKKVLHQARFKALTSIRFFQVKNKAFIQTLTETARDIILPPGEIVYYGGTVSRELYIIEKGYCLLTAKEKKQERVIGPGNHLGLLVLLYGVPAVHTVVTLTHCKLISISHAAYTSALSLFPNMREHDGLLTAEELNSIEEQAKAAKNDYDPSKYLRDTQFATSKKELLTSILQTFLDNSFINVINYYNQRKQNYWKSYNDFQGPVRLLPYLLMPIVFKPDGIFLKVWSAMRVCIAYSICLIIPIEVGMAPHYTDFNTSIILLEMACYVDLYLMLHVAYYGPKNQLIFHPYLTAKRYLKGPFIVDCLTCLPWYAIVKLFMPKHTESHTFHDKSWHDHVYHCYFRMINILQIYRLYSAFWTDTIAALKRAYLMSVVQFFLVTLFFLNLYTSCLVMFSCSFVMGHNETTYNRQLEAMHVNNTWTRYKYHPDGNMICKAKSWVNKADLVKSAEYLTPLKVYLLGYYWTITTFSGAGFGDIIAQDPWTMLLALVVNLHGVLFFGYVYAKIASLKATADQVLTKFQENIKQLELFMNREKVPFVLRKTIVDYWKYQWKRTRGWSHQKILGKLHTNLNEDAVLYMYEKTLREIPLFEDVEYSFFRAFAKQLNESYFQKGYMVMRANEVISQMYIIYRGKVDILSEYDEVEACMGPGGIFGNIRGAAKYLTMSNVIASRNTDLLCIEGPMFYTLLKSYPSVHRKVLYSVENTTKDYVLPTILSARSSAEYMKYPKTYVDENEDDDEEGSDVEPVMFLDSPEKSIAESRTSKSITSGPGNADYIRAECLLFSIHRWFRRSTIPDCKWITFWEFVTLILSYVDFMILVYEMAFLSIPHFFYLCVMFDLIFFYKLFLDVHTGYMNRYGDYVLEPRKVRNMFFSKTILRKRDFLANFNVCYLAFALPLRQPMKYRLFVYLRTPQLFRVSHVFTYKMHRKMSIGSSNLMFKLLTIGIWASILSHVFACLFFKLSCLTPVHCNSQNWMNKYDLLLSVNYKKGDYFSIYIAALWYMINLLTITGTGDVACQNDFEVIETIIIIIVIKFCAGLLISEMSAMISAHSSSRIAYDYGINELRDGLRDMDLSEHQMNKMWDYVRQLWSRQQGKQMPALVKRLPFRFRCQLMEAVYGGHIADSVIFSKTSGDFRRMLSMWMRHCVFFPGNYIVQCGDSDQCIYFIHRGEVEVLTVHSNLTESIYDVLGPEDSFGVAQGLFVGLPHHFSFRARTVVDIVSLKLEQWKYLLDFYPKSAKIVRAKVQNVYLAI